MTAMGNGSARIDHAGPLTERARTARRRYRWLRPTFGLPDVLSRLRHDAIARLELKQGDVVIDLGCGAGHSFLLLLERVGSSGRIVGLDVSPELLGQARKRIARHGWTNVELIEGDAAAFSAMAEFDGVLCFCTHDILQSPVALSRAAAALSKRGRMVAAGLKLARRLPGALLDPLVGLVARPFVTTTQNALAPWACLERLLPVAVEERLGGLGYIAVGVAPGDTPRAPR